MRFTLTACIISLAAFFSVASNAATLKIATLTPDGSAWVKLMRKAAEDIKTETDGRVKFRFYPGGVMGNDQAVLRKIRIGQLQGAALSGGALASQAPDTQIYNLPLLFENYEQVDFVRSKLDKTLEQQFEQAGWVNFGLAEGGFAYLMSKKPISNPKTLSENKVWVPSNDPAAEAASEVFSLSPTPLHVGDVLAGLQTNLVDTVFSSPIAAIALQWHTQVNYVTDLPLVYFYGLLALDKKAFNKKVSPEDQKIVRRIMGKAFKVIDKKNREDNRQAYKALLAQDIKQIQPSADEYQQWQEKTQESIKLFLQRGGISNKAYSSIQKVLSEYPEK